MRVLRILLRLTSVALAGLFAARGGLWWLGAAAYLVIAIAPVRPRATPFYFWSTVIFTVTMTAFSAHLARRGQPYALWACFALYGLLHVIHEKLAARATAAPPAPGP